MHCYNCSSHISTEIKTCHNCCFPVQDSILLQTQKIESCYSNEILKIQEEKTPQFRLAEIFPFEPKRFQFKVQLG